MRFLNPARTIIVTWTTRKSTRNPETKKCSVRADCRPPSRLTAAGTAESKAGDKARPVQITRGNRTKMTSQIGDALHNVVGVAFCFIGRCAAQIFCEHFPECAPSSVGRLREQVFPEVSSPQTCDRVDQAGQHQNPCGLKVEIAAPAILVGHHVAVAGGNRIPRCGDWYLEQRRSSTNCRFHPSRTADARSRSQRR